MLICNLCRAGWFYSKLTDVVVRRLKKQSNNNNVDSSAVLVLPDGCRNPAYKVDKYFIFSKRFIIYCFSGLWFQYFCVFKMSMFSGYRISASAKRFTFFAAQQFQLSRFPFSRHGRRRQYRRLGSCLCLCRGHWLRTGKQTIDQIIYLIMS